MLIQMLIWTMFCLVGLPALMTVAIIGLWKLAHRPPRPPGPVVWRRWDDARRSQARQQQNTWNLLFGEELIRAEAGQRARRAGGLH